MRPPPSASDAYMRRGRRCSISATTSPIAETRTPAWAAADPRPAEAAAEEGPTCLSSTVRRRVRSKTRRRAPARDSSWARPGGDPACVRGSSGKQRRASATASSPVPPADDGDDAASAAQGRKRDRTEDILQRRRTSSPKTDAPPTLPPCRRQDSIAARAPSTLPSEEAEAYASPFPCGPAARTSKATVRSHPPSVAQPSDGECRLDSHASLRMADARCLIPATFLGACDFSRSEAVASESRHSAVYSRRAARLRRS
mmetsp:Transcript_42065/g.127588  ORF Transcript_42065/g.127588 Transcript_42065/m.127588 type:complete len:257 (+) Transcript_42065:2193-2963(+)